MTIQHVILGYTTDVINAKVTSTMHDLCAAFVFHRYPPIINHYRNAIVHARQFVLFDFGL